MVGLGSSADTFVGGHVHGFGGRFRPGGGSGQAAGTAKILNLRRDPRAALEVTSSDGRSWATAEGTVTVTGPGSDPEGPEIQALVDYYRAAAGDHPDWDEYRAVMVAERRVLITLNVEHVYGDKIG